MPRPYEQRDTGSYTAWMAKLSGAISTRHRTAEHSKKSKRKPPPSATQHGTAPAQLSCICCTGRGFEAANGRAADQAQDWDGKDWRESFLHGTFFPYRRALVY